MFKEQIKITVLNGNGSGFADEYTATEGVTVAEFLNQNFTDFDAKNNIIKIDGLPVEGNHVIKSNDIVTVNPVNTKIDGGTN